MFVWLALLSPFYLSIYFRAGPRLVTFRPSAYALHFKALLQIAHKYTHRGTHSALILCALYTVYIWCASIFTAFCEPIFWTAILRAAHSWHTWCVYIYSMYVYILHIIWPATMRKLCSKDKKRHFGELSAQPLASDKCRKSVCNKSIPKWLLESNF